MKDTLIIVINGYPGAGKDTFVKYCDMETHTVNLHTSTPAKLALKHLGWNGEKTPEVRNMLSDIKQKSVELFDGSFKFIQDELEKIEVFHRVVPRIVFIHSREPEEIERFKKEFGAKTLLIKREVEEELTNDSDRNVNDYVYDVVIDNKGTLEELKEKAEAFVEIYFLGGIL